MAAMMLDARSKYRSLETSSFETQNEVPMACVIVSFSKVANPRVKADLDGSGH